MVYTEKENYTPCWNCLQDAGKIDCEEWQVVRLFGLYTKELHFNILYVYKYHMGIVDTAKEWKCIAFTRNLL